MARFFTTNNPDKDSKLHEEDIVVMFPASKNFPIKAKNHEKQSTQETGPQKQSKERQINFYEDPVEALLNEFEDYLIDEEEINIEYDREKFQLGQSEANRRRSRINNSIQELDEALERMSYYLKELEFYTQNRS